MTCHKAGHATIELAAVGAREFAMELNRRGEYAADMYAYKCHECRAWHTTRRSHWDGQPMRRVYAAKPLRLQEWAMGQQARVERVRLEMLRGSYSTTDEAVAALRAEAMPLAVRDWGA